jgi:hypothetical protein
MAMASAAANVVFEQSEFALGSDARTFTNEPRQHGHGHRDTGFDLPPSTLDGVTPQSLPKTKKEYWYCENCNHGPYLAEVHLACTNCHHRRCSRCKVEWR